MLSRTGLSEERIERFICARWSSCVAIHVGDAIDAILYDVTILCVAAHVHGAVRLDTMFQTVELPACIADLYSGLPHVDWYALALEKMKIKHTDIFSV